MSKKYKQDKKTGQFLILQQIPKLKTIKTNFIKLSIRIFLSYCQNSTQTSKLKANQRLFNRIWT